MKYEGNEKLNETYCWHSVGLYSRWYTQEFFDRINNAKRKHPTPGQFYLFPFLSGRDRGDGCTEMLG